MAIAVLIAITSMARWRVQAQDSAGQPRPKVEQPARLVPESATARPAIRFVTPPRPDPARPLSVQDAILLPCEMRFEPETALDAVADTLHSLLHAPVVLDRAALKRQKLTPKSTVALSVSGVRLKVALRLLLEQAGLTYRVEPEDNLLVFTDAQGSGDPNERFMAELHDLHRDVHDLQDAVEELFQNVAPAQEGEMKKPTIIEDAPEGKPAEPPARTRPG
jgi:hypothetical protein